MVLVSVGLWFGFYAYKRVMYICLTVTHSISVCGIASCMHRVAVLQSRNLAGERFSDGFDCSAQCNTLNTKLVPVITSMEVAWLGPMPIVMLGVGPREWSGNGYTQFQEQPSAKKKNVGRAFSPQLRTRARHTSQHFLKKIYMYAYHKTIGHHIT